MSTDQTTRTETDEERAERKQREAAEALAARAREVAGMPTDKMRREATDAELAAEDARLARSGPPRTRGPLKIHRPLAHERLGMAREAVAGAAASAITTAARGAAKPDGPNLEDVRRAYDLHGLARADDEFWSALAAAIDGPAPAGMSDLFSDTDQQGELSAARRAHDERRTAIAAELEARRIAEGVAARPGMAQRIAALVKTRG